MTDEDALNYRRGRNGRPINRVRAQLKREGSNICSWCGRPIDLSLHYLHPRAWTMDHDIPLSLRPDLWGEPSNLREMHKDCNSQKGKGQRKGPDVKGSRRW